MASRVIDVPAKRHLRVVREDETSRGRTRGRKTRDVAGTRDSASRVVAALLVSTGALTAVGLVMVLSSSFVNGFEEHGSSFHYFKRQAVYAVVGVLALMVTSRIRYRAWQRLSVPLLVVTLGLLALVLHPAAGTVAGGSARWIAIGPVTIQPSELAKLAVVLFAAAILTRKWKHLDEPMHVVIPLVPVVGAVAALVMMQPDLGTTVIIVGSVMALLFVAGLRLRYLLAGSLVCGGLGMMLIMSEGYRRARLLSFLHPSDDPLNTGWQVYQSLIALGSGGWLGVGLGQSRQKWDYVPNAHTDFIFSILGEELGIMGALGVLFLFGVLLYAGIRVAAAAPDTFGRLIAAGIVGWFGIQALVNLGAVTGLLPVTGVPLPMVSFGGSSLVVTLAAVGILINVARSSRTGNKPARKATRTA